jgi:hypothetical protein
MKDDTNDQGHGPGSVERDLAAEAALLGHLVCPERYVSHQVPVEDRQTILAVVEEVCEIDGLTERARMAIIVIRMSKHVLEPGKPDVSAARFAVQFALVLVAGVIPDRLRAVGFLPEGRPTGGSVMDAARVGVKYMYRLLRWCEAASRSTPSRGHPDRHHRVRTALRAEYRTGWGDVRPPLGRVLELMHEYAEAMGWAAPTHEEDDVGQQLHVVEQPAVRLAESGAIRVGRDGLRRWKPYGIRDALYLRRKEHYGDGPPVSTGDGPGGSNAREDEVESVVARLPAPPLGADALVREGAKLVAAVVELRRALPLKRRDARSTAVVRQHLEDLLTRRIGLTELAEMTGVSKARLSVAYDRERRAIRDEAGLADLIDDEGEVGEQESA